MVQLPEMPERIKRLPKNDRGYPVPWFVAWIKDDKPCEVGQGEPDFRAIAPGKLAIAFSRKRCWICGDALGVHKVYVIGPMCVVNRVTSEPPSHRDCAEFAAKACPFIINPREKRDKKDMPFDGSIAGIHLDRNPGAICLYETGVVKPFKAGDGYLFRLGDPTRIDWYARGRIATRAEIKESIDSGLPFLTELAERDGKEAIRQLAQELEATMKLLPAI